ncbi:twin-arginine translocase subunit TatB [Rhodobacter capsulatus]|uniref:Sec-independent protein translocase protein TatB n=1 Tax=Rhodobacter capsulatus TaxID=1061 RepID=A0A0Q0QIX1_RHOCA|nr:Sec-independent protein translocase protein TatB [Rhodobacter capsulatus]KQB14433.1 preprotein translocase subunit TatA [Rhodobacter capsulatus]KQB15087.1 preprotein translocase subunit TatA [Rhodobacter capsulatus]PZX26300.1 sec-independent protein translocase protein TatB [Rhodobacter capsulatus]QNR64201.1 twin-arginine translocase subunit TatB [Rhodobacter capsulatus]WER08013.1 Sec-independent protein translocase protein TatB [Rhodobacter capsulatus]
MFDIGWSELLLIGIVALIVVGPKDLPRMFQALGRLTAKAKRLGREFTAAMEEAARDTGVKEAAEGLNDLKSMTTKKGLGIDALERATERFENWDPKLPKPVAGAAGAALTLDPELAADLDAAELAPEPEVRTKPAVKRAEGPGGSA